MTHNCKDCPHDLTVVDMRRGGQWVKVPIASISNEELLIEYAGEVDGSTRGISSDPPSPMENLRLEILRRMNRPIWSHR